MVEHNGQRLRVMEGAVRTVAQACGLQPPPIEALEASVSQSALKRYLRLAVARGVGLTNIGRMADLKAARAQAANEAVDLLAGAAVASPKCIRRTNLSWSSTGRLRAM